MSDSGITRRSLLRSMGGIIGASLIPLSLGETKARGARAESQVIREINIKGYNRVLLPRGHGQLIKITKPMTRRYPSRDHCMQMMAFFSERSGLFVQTKDPLGYLSDWEIVPGDKLRIHFYGPEPEIEIKSIPPTIEAAAEQYRSWAGQQAWAKQKSRTGTELAFIAVASNPDFKQQIQSIKKLYDKGISPMGAWITQWRRYGYDTMYPNYLPHDPEAFAVLLSELKELQCVSFPYINALLWDNRLKDFNLGRDGALRINRRGKFLEYNRTLSHLMYACPASKTWQDIIIESRNSLRDSEGMISSGVYLDMLLAASPLLCFASGHGHVPGDPLAWQNGVRKILSSVEGMIMSEGNAEIYIDGVDALLMHLHTERVDTVPLWKLVYGDLTSSVGWKMPSAPTPEQLIAELARTKRFGASCNGSPWMTYVVQERLLMPEFKAVRSHLGWERD